MIVETKNQFSRFLKELRKQDTFAFDVETYTGLEKFRPGLLGISFCFGEDSQTYFLPFNFNTGKSLSWPLVQPKLKKIFQKPGVKIIAHNAKIDMHFMNSLGIFWTPWVDTMIAHYLLDENDFHSLKHLGKRFLRDEAQIWIEDEIKARNMSEVTEGTPFEDTDKISKWKALFGKVDDPRDANREIMGLYAELDAWLTWELHKIFLPMLAKDKKINTVFWKQEMPFIEVLFWMERCGITLDREYMIEIRRKIIKIMARAKTRIFRALGDKINLNSHKQMGEALTKLVDGAGFDAPETLAKTAAGNTKSDNATLRELLTDKVLISDFHDPSKLDELIKQGDSKIKSLWRKELKYGNEYGDLQDENEALAQFLLGVLVWRKVSKLRTTYLTPMISRTRFRRRIYGNFSQHVTVTGRLSSNDPNLQNIEARSIWDIRRGFVSREGHTLIVIDFSQAELRMLAHFSKDPVLTKAFDPKSDVDIHVQTAMDIFGFASPEDVSKEDRFKSKTLNFALIYGMGDYALSKVLGVSVPEARRLIQRYFETYRGVSRYIDRMKKLARKQGFVRTVSGRKRHLPELPKLYQKVKPLRKVRRGALTEKQRFLLWKVGHLEREAVNAPIQGSVGDMMKTAQLKIQRDEKLQLWGVRQLVQVHDEVVFECPNRWVRRAIPRLKSLMERPFLREDFSLRVPLKADVGYGSTWAEKK